MPKSSKKKKDKAADFTKARLKLGKGAKQPSNVVDTSFKARSIALPTQSIVVDKDASQPLTRRHLSFHDLVSHLRHHNPNVRKDAILGFKELLDAHWALLDSNMSTFITAIIKLIGDEDNDVRKTLLSFFNWLIPRIPTDNLVPHSHLLLLYTTSAQTHIFPEIRIDAVRFLDIFLERFPHVLAEGLDGSLKGHGQRILDGYLGLLNAGTKFGGNEGPAQATSTASVTLTPASKYVVLNSLSTFLRCALRTTDPHAPFPEATKPASSWYLETVFQNREAYLTFENILCPWRTTSTTPGIRELWKEVVEDEDTYDDFLPSTFDLDDFHHQNWSIQHLMDIPSTAADPSFEDGPSFAGNLSRTLHSTLVAILLDYAPSAFSPSETPSDTEVGLVITVVQLVCTLYQAIARESSKIPEARLQELESLLGFMSPYFPANSSGSKSIKLAQLVDTYNLTYCELVSLLLIAESQRSSRKHQKASSSLVKHHLRQFWEAGGVGQFIEQKLQRRSGTSGISTSISSSAYLDFLPSMWTFINEFATREDGDPNMILLAVLEHATKMSSKAASKRLTVEFISRLILLETDPQYRGNFRTGRRSIEDQKFRDWLLHLPQVLWELGNTNLLATETIVLALLRILQRRPRLMEAQTVMQLQARMAPYFRINHAVRGPTPGPYTKIPDGSLLRRLVLDMVSVLLIWATSSESETASSLFSAVSHTVQGTGEEQYWVSVRPQYGSYH